VLAATSSQLDVGPDDWRAEWFSGRVERIGGELADAFFIATGTNSDGTFIILNTQIGRVHEDCVQGGPDVVQDIPEYIENYKQRFRSLRLIPTPNGELVEAYHVPE